MILNTYRINEDSCDSNFDYLVEVFTIAQETNEPVYIEWGQTETRLLTSYTQFTPALHYSGLLLRIIKAKRMDVLELLDTYKEGLVHWWSVLYEVFFQKDLSSELEKKAWDGILRKKQTDVFITFFLHPELFVYTYTKLSLTLSYHPHLYEIRMAFKNKVLDPSTNCISIEWMHHKEARKIFEHIRSFHYKAEDCLENRYIKYLKEEKEKECKVSVISMFLPSSLREVVKYVVSLYV